MDTSSDGRIPIEAGHIDLHARTLTRSTGETARLTPTEAALMRYLIRFEGKTVPRDDLLRDVWGYREGVRTRTVDTTMRRLRRKVELVLGVPRHLLTEEGVGYRFVPMSELRVDAGGIAPLDATVGRDTELQLLDRLAEQGARLISLVGPGGVGKTRLAREWTRHRRAVEVTLGEIDDPEGIVPALAAAAGTNPVALPELCARLVHRGVAWIVLDDVEHLLPMVADLACTLARSDLRVLVTSRCTLHIEGDTRVELAPLSDSSAVELLRTRSPATLGPAPDAVLVDIVQRLDGLPLALEMAAARASLLGAEGLRDRRAKPLAVLNLAEPGPKKRTLAQVAQWSWMLLPASARHALRCLAVFRGGFSIDAAEAVIGDADALGALQVLRDQSWLRRRGTGAPWRLALLGPLREYIRDHEGVEPGAALLHLEYFARYGDDALRDAAEQTDGEGRHLLALEWFNLLSAIDHGLETNHLALAASTMLAAWDVTRIDKPSSALLHRTERILPLLPLDSPWRYKLQVVLAELRRSDTDPEVATRLALEAARTSEAVGDTRWTARAYGVAAVALQEHNHYERALEHHNLALEHARLAGSVRIEAIVLSNLGNLRQRQGRLSDARACLERSVQLFEAGRYARYAAISLGNLAVVWHDLGELELAEACYLRSLATHEAHGNQRYEGVVSGNLGELALDRGEPQQALDYFSDAVAIHRDLGDARLESVVRLSESEAHRMLGEVDDARARALDALALARRSGGRVFELSAEAMLIELSTEPVPLPGLRRLVAILHDLEPFGSDGATQIVRCRLLRLWSRAPRLSAADLGSARTPSELLTTVRHFLTDRGMSDRSEVGRHLLEAEAAWDRAPGSDVPQTSG